MLVGAPSRRPGRADVPVVWGAVATSAPVDLTDLDLGSAVRAVRAVGDRATVLAKDVTYTAIGLGVLAMQRAQVRRREIERTFRT
jgi:hypothetical protein